MQPDAVEQLSYGHLLTTTDAELASAPTIATDNQGGPDPNEDQQVLQYMTTQVQAKDSRCTAQLHVIQISARPQPMASRPPHSHWRLGSGWYGPDDFSKCRDGSSGAVDGEPQCVGLAAWKMQSSRGLSAVQLLLKRWGKWSFGCLTARGTLQSKNRNRSEQLESL